MNKLIQRLLFDQKLARLDKRYRKQMMQTEDPKEEEGLRLLHKYIRIYQIWRRNMILGVLALILGLIVLFAVGKGVSAAVGQVKSYIQAERKRKEQEAEEERKRVEESERLQREEEERLKKEEEERRRKETETEDTLDQETSITLSFTGDCILGTDETFAYDLGFTQYYDYYGPEYFMQNVRDIFQKDDLTIVNFEGTLTEETAREPKQFAFKADPEYVDIISNSSVEAANLANNHSHDYGEQSYLDTKRILEENNIRTFGYDDVSLIEVKGVRVGIYGIYELDDHQERIPQMLDNIQKLKDMKADIIIGVFHWSNELEVVPDYNQLEIGHLAIDEGTDLIVGHHPHVIQGIEEYNGKNIVYSLGNFCFGGNLRPYNLDTFIYQQTFTLDTDRKLKSTESNIIPCWISSDYTKNNYQPTPMTGQEYDDEMDKIDTLSSLVGTDGSTYWNPAYDYYSNPYAYGGYDTSDYGYTDYGTDYGYTDYGTDYGYADNTYYGY